MEEESDNELDGLHLFENSWLYQDSNSDLLVIQPIDSRYIICAIPAPGKCPDTG
jgi:hypothetical protein